MLRPRLRDAIGSSILEFDNRVSCHGVSLRDTHSGQSQQRSPHSLIDALPRSRPHEGARKNLIYRRRQRLARQIRPEAAVRIIRLFLKG